MKNFNKFVDEGIKIFSQGQMQIDGFDLESGIISDYVYCMLQFYKLDRRKFFDNIDEIFFELGSLQMKTTFFFYLYFSETYINTINRNVSEKYLISLIKILACIKKMDLIFERTYTMNKLITEICSDGIEVIFDDFFEVNLRMADSVIYFDFVNLKERSKLSVVLNYKTYGESTSTFILPYNYQQHPVLGDSRKYYSYMKLNRWEFIKSINNENSDFIDLISPLINKESVAILTIQPTGN